MLSGHGNRGHQIGISDSPRPPCGGERRLRSFRMDIDKPGAMVGSSVGAISEPSRRFEIFTAAGQRRRSSTEKKLALVSLMARCDNISELARRRYLRPSQLFPWRRELRSLAEDAQRSPHTLPEPMFVPAVIEPPVDPVPERTKPGRARQRRGS